MGFDEISDMFSAESEKLKILLDSAENPELPIHEIVKTYYQVINVSSMIVMLKQQLDADEHGSLLDQIAETEKMISEKFNSDIHPRIMQSLADSVRDSANSLQSGDSSKKSIENIENESKLYEVLRKKMSTKEFVEQYDQGL